MLTTTLVMAAMMTLTLSTAFGLPPANRGTDNARGKVNTGITSGEMHPMKTMSEAKRPRPTVLYAKTPTSLCC